MALYPTTRTTSPTSLFSEHCYATQAGYCGPNQVKQFHTAVSHLAGVLGARPVRREPVTPAEATAAARRAVAELRDCEGIPATLTADLDIVRGRGTVTMLNLHPLALNDPRYPWHACVQQSLERVRFPMSGTAGQTRVRLTLR